MRLALLLILSVLLFDVAVSSRLNNLRSKNGHKLAAKSQMKKTKIVHYAIKQDETFKVISVGAKDLTIEPYHDWSAKAIFNGNDYNSTG
jgi:hypothetical protein